MFNRIKLKNILSFGPDGLELELKPLNVLIGPNGSGKSNLIEVIGLLKAAPTDLAKPIREGGGTDDWIWRGEQKEFIPTARVEASVDCSWRYGGKPIRYSLEFSPFVLGILQIEEEIAMEEESRQETDKGDFYLERKPGKVALNYRDESGGMIQRDFPPTEITPGQSILTQLKDPFRYPQLTFLGNHLGEIRLYREWSFGRNTPPRLPQRADVPNDFLAEDGMNLGMVLNRFKEDPKAKNQFMNALGQLYDGVEDFGVKIVAGTVQVILQEGNITMPATRLSDGTLRYLCLLAILCHPTPPPLVCLEEPELGLHPDILPGFADLLREASERCQLIVTTHSDTLVDALTDIPESVVVCEKEKGQTRMKRLDKEELSHWLEKYRLGELWSSGELGGNRW